MMDRMRDRIFDERGASIIIALVFLLICTVVAAVIVNYATTNVERSRQHAQEQQDYLTASSAMLLVEDAFENDSNLKFTMASGSNVDAVFASGNEGAMGGSPLGDWAASSAKAVYVAYANGSIGSYSESNSTSDPFTISVQNPYDGAMDDVSVVLTMGRDYRITAKMVTVPDEYTYDLQVSIPVSTYANVALDGSGKPVSGYAITWYSKSKASDAKGYTDEIVAIQRALGFTGGAAATSANAEIIQTQWMSAHNGRYPNLTEAEAACSSVTKGKAASYVWKPVIANDGSVVLCACPSNSDLGAAESVALIYADGTYYKYVRWWRDTTYSWIPDGASGSTKAFDKAVLSTSAWNSYWEQVTP